MRRLSCVVLAFAIVFLCLAIALPEWQCGGLFDSCTRGGGSNRTLMIAVTALLVIGTALLAIVFIMDLVSFCSTVTTADEIIARFVMLYIGASLTLIAVIVYTVQTHQKWSYFLAVVGTIFATQVAILATMMSRCRSRTATKRIARGFLSCPA
ncbi:hypothetical protein SprV_0301107100 [Sparganum proliferum]